MRRKRLANCGIYQIENIITGDCYVGKGVSVFGRRRYHFGALYKNIHFNKHLQHAFDKYGIENFAFKVILYCERFELHRYEQECVDRLNSVYNIERDCVDTRLGVKHTEESKLKMSIVAKKRIHFPLSEEHKHKLSLALIGNTRFKGKVPWNKGVRPSDETIEKIRVGNIGRTISEQNRQALIQSNRDRIWSEESKLKESLSHKGHKLSEETKHKMSEAHIGNQHTKGHKLSKEHIQKLHDSLIGNTRTKGHKASDETKNKMAASHRLRWETIRLQKLSVENND